MKADFQLRFINSAVNEFENGKECGDESFVIPSSLLGITKPFISIKISFCKLDENKSKHFLKKFQN